MPADQTTRYLKLPFPVDTAALERDVQRVRALRWIAHYNKYAYHGNWHCLSLRANNGAADDILALDEGNFIDTPLLRHCPDIEHVLQRLECEKKSVRLMTLAAGSRILPHVDRGGNFEQGIARLHIPIITHPNIRFEVDAERIHFSVGCAWYLNTCCVHAVRNDSTTDRVHLVVDCVPNPWLTELFLRAGWVRNAEAYYGDPMINDDNVLDVILGLRQSNHERALELAEKLSNLRTLRTSP